MAPLDWLFYRQGLTGRTVAKKTVLPDIFLAPPPPPPPNPPSTFRTVTTLVDRELKQRRCRRLRKHHLKSEYALLQSLSCLFHLVQFVKCWQMLNSKGLYRSSGKEKESRLVFTSSTKRKIRHFHVVVVQSRQKSVMHVQICCFANLNL